MKVVCSLKLICKYCKIIKKKGKQRVKCFLTGRHNQRKDFSSSLPTEHSKINENINDTKISLIESIENIEKVIFSLKLLDINNRI
jgi:ribosomal protein L36